MNDTYLLLCERDKSIFPVCDSTFTATQTTLSKLKKNYIGCIVIKRDGEVKKIKTILKKELWGKSFGRKLLSAFTGAYSISVEFTPLGTLPLADFKLILKEYLILDNSSDDPCLKQDLPIEQILKKIESATTVETIFDVLDMPDVDECLDLL